MAEISRCARHIAWDPFRQACELFGKDLAGTSTVARRQRLHAEALRDVAARHLRHEQ